ncbi:MAG: FAD-dependent oxidoreductase, partial [Thermoplasmata archaeon]|nr:FAD-dependent oxidoreductase [Thermoplasmata archaeon]
KIVGSKSGWIRSMVYGFPPAGFPGIGIHLTRTIAGELLVGPSATYLNSAVPESARITALSDFHEEASVLLPDLELADLEFGPVGVRAKPVPPGSEEPFQDFTVREDPPGRRVIQMIGIESPGLTASLSLGEHVASLWRASAAR